MTEDEAREMYRAIVQDSINVVEARLANTMAQLTALRVELETVSALPMSLVLSVIERQRYSARVGDAERAACLAEAKRAALLAATGGER